MYRNMGVSSTPLRVSSREHGVNQHKGPNNLSTQPNSFAVACTELIGSTAILGVVALLESLDQSNTGYSPQRLSHHVQNSSDQRHLASQEQPKCHCRVYVTSCSHKTHIKDISFLINLCINKRNHTKATSKISAFQLISI